MAANQDRSTMGKGGGSGGDYEACTVCTRVCQTTHGKGLPHSVPRFLKTIPEYSTPSNKNCNLQIPAAYVREHMGMSIEETYILEDVTGSEWVVISSSATLKNGWKAFAVDYQLEKGDQIMFGLVAPKRFYVSVFDKSGMEKVSTRQHLNSMGSTGTAMDKESELAPQVSKPMSGGAEDPCTPMNLAHSKGATRRARSNDTSQHNSQLLVSNDVGALPSRNASDQNGNQKGILCNGVSINSHLPNEPVDRHVTEGIVMNESSDESEDSVQMLLAKAVLAKAKQRKLNKRKMSCHNTRQAKMALEAISPECVFKNEMSQSFEDKIRAMKSKCRNAEIVSNSLARLSSDNVTSSLRDDFATSHDGIEADLAIREEPLEDGRVLMNGSSRHQVGVSKAGVDLRRDEPHNHHDRVNGLPDEVMKEIPLPGHKQNDVMTQMTTPRVATAQDPILNGVQGEEAERSDQFSPVFEPALVKSEPGVSFVEDLGPAMVAAGAHVHENKICANCGLPTDAENLKSEFVTPEVSEIPKDNNLILDAVTSEEPESTHAKGPNSSAPIPFSGDDSTTEYQKRWAHEAAKSFSANMKNPSAIIVMRSSFVKNTYACFVTVKCAGLLPTKPAELSLVDTDGYVRKANWRPGKRYMLGAGWKDFVETHNVQESDVCVLELIDRSQVNCKLLVHVFRAREMEREHEQSIPAPGATPVIEASPRARTHAEGKRGRAANGLLLPGLLPSTRKRRKSIAKSLNNEVVEIGLPVPSTSPDDEVAEPGLTFERGKPTKQGSATKRVRRHSMSTHTQIKKVAKDETRSSPRGAVVEKQQDLLATPSQKSHKHYTVKNLIDRRRGLQGVLFLVELKETVILQGGSKKKPKMSATQDGRGRWWVPHHHFNHDFSEKLVCSELG